MQSKCLHLFYLSGKIYSIILVGTWSTIFPMWSWSLIDLTVIWLIWQIDKEALDKQIKEKKEQDEAQKAQKKVFGESHMCISVLFFNFYTDCLREKKIRHHGPSTCSEWERFFNISWSGITLWHPKGLISAGFASTLRKKVKRSK